VVAAFFNNKVKELYQDLLINPNIYNSRVKLLAIDSFFMGKKANLDCVKSLKLKICESFDRLPQRILKDSIDHLANP
jgi:hypothetical protein